MVCKIADFFIEVKNQGEVLLRLCREYICEAPPRIDFSVQLTEEDINYELAISNLDKNVVGSIKLAVELALYRKICACALERDAFLMHGVAIDYKSEGYVFSATSGTGKTTHVRIWKKVFGEEKVVIVNGDKPIIRFLDDKVYAYGTPWNGKEHYGTNGRVEIKHVCFLKRGEKNIIRRLSSEEILPLLFSQIMIHDSSNLTKQLEYADRFIEKVPMYLLECNMEEEAALVAFSGMQDMRDGG